METQSAPTGGRRPLKPTILVEHAVADPNDDARKNLEPREPEPHSSANHRSPTHASPVGLLQIPISLHSPPPTHGKELMCYLCGRRKPRAQLKQITTNCQPNAILPEVNCIRSHMETRREPERQTIQRPTAARTTQQNHTQVSQDTRKHELGVELNGMRRSAH